MSNLVAMYFGGLNSDVEKSPHPKVIRDFFDAKGIPCIIKNYPHHGEGEDFSQFTISEAVKWGAEIINSRKEEKILLVGNGFGAWPASLLAIMFPERVVGMVFAEPMLDFTLPIFNNFPEMVQESILKNGFPQRTANQEFIVAPEFVEDSFLDENQVIPQAEKFFPDPFLVTTVIEGDRVRENRGGEILSDLGKDECLRLPWGGIIDSEDMMTNSLAAIKDILHRLGY